MIKNNPNIAWRPTFVPGFKINGSKLGLYSDAIEEPFFGSSKWLK